MRFTFHPLALEEAIQAVNWYRQEGGQQAALDFALNAQQSIELIRKYPSIGTPTIRQARRFLLKTFPYWLVYRVEGDILRILAFAHQRRRPEYWAKRR